MVGSFFGYPVARLFGQSVRLLVGHSVVSRNPNSNLSKFLPKHITNCTVSLFQLIGPQFIQAIQPSLEERWTPELHEAWIQLFKYMAYIMKNSMCDEEQRVSAQQ
jgi:hemoglobin-like flavoprotein